jgi:hypothetical protein
MQTIIYAHDRTHFQGTVLERQHIASQWGLQLTFRMHNSDPTPQGVENRNILLWVKCVLFIFFYFYYRL